MESVREVSLARGKLEFWSDSLDLIYNDKRQSEPITIALHHAAKTNKIPKHYFKRIIESRLIELNTPHI